MPALDKPNNKPFQALPYGKPGKPKPIGQTKPFTKTSRAMAAARATVPDPAPAKAMVKATPTTSEAECYHAARRLVSWGEASEADEARFHLGRRQARDAWSLERERAPQAKPVITGVKNPQHVWIAEKNGVPGHWERQRADGKYQIYWDKDGSSYWVPQY